jgi:hypothetical protein
MTQQRGSADTLERDIWGGAEPSGRPLLMMLLLALMLHVPAVPTRLSRWITFLLPTPVLADDGPQQDLVVPIDVDLLGEEPPPPSATAEPVAKAPKPIEKALEDSPSEDAIDEDAFFDDDPAEAAPAPEAPKPPEPAATSEEPEAPKPPPKEALPVGKLKDTFDAAGAVGAVRARHPNVNVYMASDVLRRSKLTPAFSKLLQAIPQWRQLIGGTGLDPMRDFDRILISGPQFRNPKWIVIAIRFNTTAARIKKALDGVIKRTKGKAEWIDPLTARIGKNGERYAVIVPGKRTLWILPADQKEDLERVREAGAFARTPPAGIVIDLKKPANAFKGAPFKFPSTITHVRLHFTMVKGGNYKVVAEGWDKSRAHAKRNAALLKDALDAVDMTKQIEDVALMPSFVKSWVKKRDVRVVGDTTFEVKGNRIVARADVSDKQLERIMRLAQNDIDQRTKNAKKRKKKADDAKAKLKKTGDLLDKLRKGRLARPKPGATTKPAVGVPSGAPTVKEPPLTPPAPEPPKPNGSDLSNP